MVGEFPELLPQINRAIGHHVRLLITAVLRVSGSCELVSDDCCLTPPVSEALATLLLI
jgi:hypothetical protein